VSKSFAFVGEGKTDFTVFAAALLALPGGDSSVVTQIQPPFDQLSDPDDQGSFGGGWPGVMLWCETHRVSGNAPTIADILYNFDTLVIHLDTDIAREIELRELQLSQPCPPALSVHETIAAYLDALLELAPTGEDQTKVVYMIPCQATESWIISGLFAHQYGPPPDLECLEDPATWLYGKTPRFVRMKQGRVRKVSDVYIREQSKLAANWPAIRTMCSCAEAFSSHLEICLA
jgi:hypothetical protein